MSSHHFKHFYHGKCVTHVLPEQGKGKKLRISEDNPSDLFNARLEGHMGWNQLRIRKWLRNILGSLRIGGSFVERYFMVFRIDMLRD